MEEFVRLQDRTQNCFNFLCQKVLFGCMVTVHNNQSEMFFNLYIVATWTCTGSFFACSDKQVQKIGNFGQRLKQIETTKLFMAGNNRYHAIRLAILRNYRTTLMWLQKELHCVSYIFQHHWCLFVLAWRISSHCLCISVESNLSHAGGHVEKGPHLRWLKFTGGTLKIDHLYNTVCSLRPVANHIGSACGQLSTGQVQRNMRADREKTFLIQEENIILSSLVF